VAAAGVPTPAQVHHHGADTEAVAALAGRLLRQPDVPLVDQQPAEHQRVRVYLKLQDESPRHSSRAQIQEEGDRVAAGIALPR
jgi:hypothetical protein